MKYCFIETMHHACKRTLIIVLLSLVIILIYKNQWTFYLGCTDCQVLENTGYLVRTPACIIPNYKPFGQSINTYLKKSIKINCNPAELEPLTTANLTSVQVLNTPSVLRKYGLKPTTISCCYQEITRINEVLANFTKECDNKYSLGICQKISLEHGSTVTAEGILVRCSNQKTKKEVYKNVHYFYPLAKTQKKIDAYKKRQKIESATRPLNVILLGIDSTSRQNMRRYMPKTFKILSNDENTIDIKGYNKIADNTDPNVSAILMGIDPVLLLSYKMKCYKYQAHHFDTCPLIWKKFSEKGYVTAYGEDSTSIGLYHFNKIGFVEPPTDYYLRPSQIVADKEIGHKNVEQHACQGLNRSCEVILDTTLKAMDSLSADIPMFGYFYTTSMTHQRNEGAGTLDEPFVNFFTEFTNRGHQNNSIIIFYSDHGMRFGNIRSTHIGRVEERMPFVFLKFPHWFKKAYPQTWNNLKTNQNRLVSNYDVHLTLLDIIDESYNTSSNNSAPSGHGQSLFNEVPMSRTCEAAGIPEHYCSCQSSHEVSVEDEVVTKGAKLFVQYINDQMLDFASCAQLSLHQIISAQSSTIELKPIGQVEIAKNETTGTWQTLMLTVETTPGFGRFEGTVVKEDINWKISEEISRLNLYGDQSLCVKDPKLKKICYCV